MRATSRSGRGCSPRRRCSRWRRPRRTSACARYACCARSSSSRTCCRRCVRARARAQRAVGLTACAFRACRPARSAGTAGTCARAAGTRAARAWCSTWTTCTTASLAGIIAQHARHASQRTTRVRQLRAPRSRHLGSHGGSSAGVMAAYPPAVKSTIPFMFTYKAGIDTKVLQMTRRCCIGQSPTEIALAMREYYHHSFMEAQAAYYRVVDALRAAGGGAQPRMDAVFAASQPVRLGCAVLARCRLSSWLAHRSSPLATSKTRTAGLAARSAGSTSPPSSRWTSWSSATACTRKFRASAAPFTRWITRTKWRAKWCLTASASRAAATSS